MKISELLVTEEHFSESEIAKKLEKFHDELVPGSGAADTKEGELVRAVSRVGYRWLNDGDYFYEGYGATTAGPSVTYLAQSDVPGIDKLIRNAEGKREESYEAAIHKVMAAVVAYIESKNGQYEKNDGDSRDHESEWQEEYDDEEDDSDYDDDPYADDEDD